MKLFFERIPLDPANLAERLRAPFQVIDGAEGYDKNVMTLTDTENTIIYSNSLVCLLEAQSFWNEETHQFDIYMRNRHGLWFPISELTERELRKPHNILNLFIGGAFND